MGIMLGGFRDYLIKKALVNENQIDYYLKWVSACYSFLDRAGSEVLERAEKARFLKHLSKTYEDWQVDQADNALRIYDYFLASDNADRPESGKAADDGWPALEAR